MTTKAQSFLDSIMMLPKKPDFIGFVVETEVLFDRMVDKLNEIMGMDLSSYCSHDSADDGELLFYIDEYQMDGELENYGDILNRMPFDYDAPWESAQYLIGKVYGVDTWAYGQVRFHDPSQCEVQIGVPVVL
jgi:hypothetical protein